jgi:hypothetical protein
MTFQTFESFENLKLFCNEFDKKHNCLTTFSQLTLNEIRSVLNRPYEHNYITQLVETMFKDKSVVFSNDLSVPESPIGKLNSFYLIINDILTSKNFYNPICISLFDDGYIIHPGNTRLLFSEIYPHPVDVMITDYKKTPCHFKQSVINFDKQNNQLFFGYSKDLNNPYVPKHYRQRDIYFKQIVDSRVDKNDFSYHKPREISPPRIFQLKKKQITVNEKVIMRCIKKQWRLVLE